MKAVYVYTNRFIGGQKQYNHFFHIIISLNFHFNYKHVKCWPDKIDSIQKKTRYLGLQYISLNLLDPEKIIDKLLIVCCVVKLDI